MMDLQRHNDAMLLINHSRIKFMKEQKKKKLQLINDSRLKCFQTHDPRKLFSSLSCYAKKCQILANQ